MGSKNSQRGFTLIEIMVVVAIIGLIGTIVTVNVMGSHGRAQVATARVDVLQMQDVLVQYRLYENQLPGSLAELVKPDEKGKVWITGFSSTPKDPWGNPYMLVSGEGDPPFEVISFGPDGSEGTEDDITSRTARDS